MDPPMKGQRRGSGVVFHSGSGRRSVFAGGSVRYTLHSGFRPFVTGRLKKYPGLELSLMPGHLTPPMPSDRPLRQLKAMA